MRDRPTPRQLEVLQHFSLGRSTVETARRMGVSTETVRTHVRLAIATTQCHDRTHAVAVAIRRGWVT